MGAKGHKADHSESPSHTRTYMDNKVQAIDPSNPPKGMFMVLIIDRINEQGQIETTVQGKIDETYAIECAMRGVEVLKIHHAKLLKEGIKNTGDMKILGAGDGI